MFWVSRKNRLPLTIALIVGLVVIATILIKVRGATPDAGHTYTGTVIVVGSGGRPGEDLAMSFTVDATGKAVEDFHFSDGLPRACSASTRLGSVQAGSAPIVSPSKFLARLAIDRDGTRVGTLIISGVFHSLNREEGAVQTSFSAADLRGCGTGGGYSAKA